MNVTLEGTRNMYVDGASNNEILPSKWRNFKGERRVNPKTNKTINAEFHQLVSMGVFLKVVKKIFELDALIDNTFKENSVKLGRKVLKLRLRAVKIR